MTVFPHHPVPRGGRPARRPPRDHRRRQDRGRRDTDALKGESAAQPWRSFRQTTQTTIAPRSCCGPSANSSPELHRAQPYGWKTGRGAREHHPCVRPSRGARREPRAARGQPQRRLLARPAGRWKGRPRPSRSPAPVSMRWRSKGQPPDGGSRSSDPGGRSVRVPRSGRRPPELARRSIVRTLRQPPRSFPQRPSLILLAINSVGLKSATSLPGFPPTPTSPSPSRSPSSRLASSL